MFKKVVQHGRSERGGEAYRGPVALQNATGERYVEPLSDARTKLAAFFNILLGIMANAHKHKGRIFLHRGDLAQARRSYEQAVAEDRETGTPNILSDSLGNLGNVCAMQGDYQAAEQCYREILEIQRSLQDNKAIGQTLVHLGNIHAEAGRSDKARAWYLEAQDVLEQGQDYRTLGVLHSNLALQEVARDRPLEAITLFKKALDSHRLVGDEEALARTYSQLGKTYLQGGQSHQAERCLNNASEHFLKLGNEVGEAAVLRLLADLYETRNDFLSSYRCMERVVSVNSRYGLAQAGKDSERLIEIRKRLNIL